MRTTDILQGLDIGFIINLCRRYSMLPPIPGDKNNFSASYLAYPQRGGWLSISCDRIQVMLILYLFYFVQPRSADNTYFHHVSLPHAVFTFVSLTSSRR